ncbi:TrkH family potassium uptake protein [Mycoplasma sp. NEAQ87857]|uniref:potassium transporter TrkG n=1 Tax=Mycoplasma sp. NEAQ87857 TaxID=2683967 RepID=UPI001318E677|nr:potassium transporter TrkG [Mycoplasma sp. NEAQ87857]QGZ97566.1 TrkH family potassium uptake protein [Mycoplasma sp. NEAQ87857]
MNWWQKTLRNIKKSWLGRGWNRFWLWKNNVSKLKYLLFWYIVIVVASSLLLYSPITQNDPNNAISYVDSVFTTASAFSDTGLVVVDTWSHWNWFGQAIIAVLILAGGIGIFALKFFLINYLFGVKKSTLGEMKLLQDERGGVDANKTSKLIIDSVKFLLVAIFIFSIILSIYFYFASPENFQTAAIKKDLNNNYKNPHHNWLLAIRFGIFHTISAINNAGFDIISGNSLMPYYSDYFLQSCFIILLIIGGLGYPTLYDIVSYFQHKIKRKKHSYKFSLFTKVSLVTYLLVFIVGFILSLSLEISSHDPFSFWNKMDLEALSKNQQHLSLYNQYLAKGLPKLSKEYVALEQYYYYGGVNQKLFAIFFSSLSTRSAGFGTINLKDLTSGSIFVFTIMMIIGAAPASTGGGIRTTTFALFIMSIVSMLMGLPRIRMFKRSINKETVDMSAKVIAIALVVILIATLICYTSFNTYNGKINLVDYQTNLELYQKFPQLKNFLTHNTPYGTEHVLFEVASAFGTTGLSTGLTKSLNFASKVAIIIVMFIGQFGISSTLLVWKRKHSNNRRYEYIDGDLTIG